MKTRALALSCVLAAILTACASASDVETPETDSSEQDLSRNAGVKLVQTDLVSDRPGAVTQDKNLVNPWGIAFNAQGGAWVSNNHSATSTVYDATGKLLLTVTVPTAPGSTEGGAPTGQVFNTTAGFKGDKFIFADEHGTISGWQPGPAGTVLRSDQTSANAGYKGLALVGATILAADFHNGKIDTFDANYTKIPTTGFVDPTLPHGYAPFNVQTLDGKVYVTYAQQDDKAEDDVQGAGKGFVNVFALDGTRIGRVASRGTLNAPWGLALAPATFGKLAGKLLVGNFGSGTIQAFDVTFSTSTSGGGYGSAPVTTTSLHTKHVGAVLSTAGYGKQLSIPALWAITFSPATGELFFTAAPDHESHGLFGKLTIAP